MTSWRHGCTPSSPKGTCQRLLPASHTLSQTRIITSGNHASARGSHEETLSRPDFYRGRNKHERTHWGAQRTQKEKQACEDAVCVKAPLETRAHLGAVKVNDERLHGLRDLGSDQELARHHAQIDLRWIVLVINGPGVKPHRVTASCFHTSIFCSEDI